MAMTEEERAKFKPPAPAPPPPGVAFRLGREVPGVAENIAIGAAGVLDGATLAHRAILTTGQNLVAGATGAPVTEQRPYNILPFSNYAQGLNFDGSARVPASDSPAGSLRLPAMAPSHASTPGGALSGAVDERIVNPNRVSYRGADGSSGDISLSGPRVGFATPDQMPQQLGPIRENSIAAASAEYMRRNPGVVESGGNPRLETTDFGVRQLTPQEVLAARETERIKSLSPQARALDTQQRTADVGLRQAEAGLQRLQLENESLPATTAADIGVKVGLRAQAEGAGAKSRAEATGAVAAGKAPAFKVASVPSATRKDFAGAGIPEAHIITTDPVTKEPRAVPIRDVYTPEQMTGLLQREVAALTPERKAKFQEYLGTDPRDVGATYDALVAWLDAEREAK